LLKKYGSRFYSSTFRYTEEGCEKLRLNRPRPIRNRLDYLHQRWQTFLQPRAKLLPQITYPARRGARRNQCFQQLLCMLEFWYTCCVYLHSSPILGLYVVILRPTQSAVFIFKASPRSHFIYCIVENSCSREYVDPKNDNAANAKLVIVWNNLAISSTRLKLGFYRCYDVLSLEYAPKFRSFNSIHLATRSLVEIFPKCNFLVFEYWKWLNMPWNFPV
jgi:hypothetical protein